MRRTDLQTIARSKIDDAKLLLEHDRYANAYYLAGYAVEIGLKACIARGIPAEVIPDRRFVQSIYDHDLTKLVWVAGLADLLKERRLASRVFDENWSLVSVWRPEARYEDKPFLRAWNLVQAVGHAEEGVLAWIEAYW